MTRLQPLPAEPNFAELFPPSTREQWRALVEADLKGASFERRLVTHTYEGLYVQPLYTQADRLTRVPGPSGQMPLTRGARPLGTAVSGWEIRQERSEADPARVNEAIREDLEGGVGAVTLRLDACARQGLDPLGAEGGALVGVDGCAIHDVLDLDRALAGVHLEMIGVCLESGAAFTGGAALLAALWEKRGVPVAQRRGCFHADPMAVLARDGQLPYGLDQGLGLMADLAGWTHATLTMQGATGVRSVRVGTAAYHHAGATATQDLAFSMATALEYLRAMTGEGGGAARLGLREACGQIEFSFAVGCNIFLAIAKLRASRRLWARVVQACGGSDEDARRMRMSVRPSKRVLTTRDPWVNMLRNTACVFAGALGGADAIGGVPFDAPLGDPSPLGRRVARNTHHILMEECHLHRVQDALGGSWYIEKLSDDLAAQAWVILQAIEARGGMGQCLTSGWIAEQIDGALQPRVRNLSTRKDVVVGVSDFPVTAEVARPAAADRRALHDVLRARLERGRTRVREARPEAVCAWAVAQASAGATVGDIDAALPFGARTHAVIPRAVHVHPYAEPFEQLREACDALAEECGARPRVYLAVLGSPAQRLARANFCANLFEAGGFEVVGREGEGTRQSALEGFAASEAHIAVICGPDEQYAEHAVGLAGALHRAGARRVVLAGNPGAAEATYREAGVDMFVYVKCDVVALLRELLQGEGVKVS